MNILTGTKEVNFEMILGLYYKLRKSDISIDEDTFVKIISYLERSLQDLQDTYWGEEARDAILIKLKYWTVIVDSSSDVLEENYLPLLLYSFTYHIRYLGAILAILEDTTTPKDHIARIKSATPTPDENFVDDSEGLTMPTVRFPELLAFQMIENSIEDRFGDHFGFSIEPEDYRGEYDEWDLENLREDLEIKGYFENTLDDFISSPFRGLSEISTIPISIYLDTTDNDLIRDVEKSITTFLNTIDADILFSFTPIRGSWFKRFIAKFRKFKNSDEFQDRLNRLEHGLETGTTGKYQAENDKNQAEAFAEILKSTSDVPRLAILIGSLLIIKEADENQKPIVFARTLTPKQMIILNKNPALLQKPHELLTAISERIALPQIESNPIE